MTVLGAIRPLRSVVLVTPAVAAVEGRPRSPGVGNVTSGVGMVGVLGKPGWAGAGEMVVGDAMPEGEAPPGTPPMGAPALSAAAVSAAAGVGGTGWMG